MIYIKPDFFNKFKCIGSQCKDNCCIGWEIDVDDCTYSRYLNMNSSFGEDIRNHITTSEDGSRCFQLAEGERCPFLNSDNLCDIIVNCGEEGLCDICREHPRFYEWFPGVTECGLGLSCEEVCRLLLNSEEIFSLEEYSDGEKIALNSKQDVVDSDMYIVTSALRDIFFSVLKDNSISLEDKIVGISNKIQSFTGEKFILKKDVAIIAAYEKTEPIDEQWSAYISYVKNDLEGIKCFEKNLLEKEESNFIYSQILAYILYRHFIKAAFDRNFAERVGFCIEGLRFIMLSDMATIALKGKLDFEDRVNNIKNWSKQIEYSTENTNFLIYGDIL